MRSRTEMVTTTFVDSEDESEDETESEDDWKPASANKKRSLKTKPKQTKRRSAKKKKISDSEDDDEVGYNDESEEEDDFSDENDYEITSMEPSLPEPVAKAKNVSKEKKDNEKFTLFVSRKDLDENYKNNLRLCLWRRDKGSLLQKYIRVKTDNNNDLVFTSSSVYSSWDENCSDDFKEILVEPLKENPKRVKILTNELFIATKPKQSGNEREISKAGKANAGSTSCEK